MRRVHMKTHLIHFNIRTVHCVHAHEQGILITIAPVEPLTAPPVDGDGPAEGGCVCSGCATENPEGTMMKITKGNRGNANIQKYRRNNGIHRACRWF